MKLDEIIMHYHTLTTRKTTRTSLRGAMRCLALHAALQRPMRTRLYSFCAEGSDAFMAPRASPFRKVGKIII